MVCSCVLLLCQLKNDSTLSGRYIFYHHTLTHIFPFNNSEFQTHLRHSKFIFLNFPFSSCSECDPYTEKACRDAANSLGLVIGGAGYTFAGDYATNGFYAYSSGPYNGRVYYGTGGKVAQMKALPGPYNKVIGAKYRPVGYDCNNSGI